LRKFAICELSTLNASFEDDLAAYSAAGADGISIFEGKLVAVRALAEESARLGIPVALEPMSTYERADWTLVTTLGEAAALVDDAGADVRLVFETWHLGDSPELGDDLERYADRIVAVQVNDWREPTRSWCDRVLPGDGVIDLGPLLDAVERTGRAGCYDLEVFSDDAKFGNDF